MSGVIVQKNFSLFVAAPLVGGVRQPNFDKLAREIDADVAITTALIHPGIRPYNMSVPDIALQFAGALSGPEVVALDLLIAAHDGLDLVRPTNTDTHLFPGGAPTVTDDSSVVGVDGLPKYRVGDLGIDTSAAPTYVWYILSDDAVGAAVWTPSSTGGGEVNTASNVGGANALFKQKSGVDLQFYTLAQSDGIGIAAPAADSIEISNTLTGANVGAGNGIFRDKTTSFLNLKSLIAGAGVSITPGADALTIAATGSSGPVTFRTRTTTVNSISTTPVFLAFDQEDADDPTYFVYSGGIFTAQQNFDCLVYSEGSMNWQAGTEPKAILDISKNGVSQGVVRANVYSSLMQRNSLHCMAYLSVLTNDQVQAYWYTEIGTISLTAGTPKIALFPRV